MDLTIVGLGIIVVAWLVQFVYMIIKKNKVNPFFVLIYIIGVAVLTYNGFAVNMTWVGILELASLIASGLVFAVSLKK